MNFNCPRIFHSALFLFFILLSVSGCGGGGGGAGGGAGGTSSAPSFNGVAVAIPSAAGGEVTLSWDAATDDATASSAMVYDISVATITGAPFAVTHTSAAGATSYTVTGLMDDTDYFFVVRARDEAGNRDSNTVEAMTHELIGTMNLRGVPMPGIPGAIAFTYLDEFCNTLTLYFDDGSSDEQSCPGDGLDVTVNHQFTQAGIYHVTLDNLQGETSDFMTFTITSAAAIGAVLNDVIISTSATSGGTWFNAPQEPIPTASGATLQVFNPTASGATIHVFIPNISGATVSVADIESRLAGGTSVVITTVNQFSDLIVNAPISWNANRLTLNSMRDIKVNAVMTASGTALLDLEHEFNSGIVKMGFNADGTFKGRVDFPGRTGAGILTIGAYPYTIINSLGSPGSNTAADLQGMDGNLALFYALGGDIDASETSTWNTGAGFAPVGNPEVFFDGKFDGLGHTISGLTINRSAINYVGLFGFTKGAKINNVGLLSGSISGGDYVGGLVGQTSTGSNIISNSYNTSDVSGYFNVGGLIGSNSGSITRSYNTGIVRGTFRVGGLAGESVGRGGAISDSFSTGDVTGICGECGYIGGLVGANDAGISNSFSVGNVSGMDSIGGLVGNNAAGSISNSYSTGSVSGDSSFGGLVGQLGIGISTNSFWDTQTSGQATSAAGTGLTTNQMKAQASFTGWDFDNTWSIVEGASYPTLKIFE